VEELSPSQKNGGQSREAPAGAPNVVWILIDDVGFGAAGTFAG